MDTLQDHPALLAALIFAARVTDVSMGTVRTILVVRGHRLASAAIGFFEVLVWLAAAGLVLQNLTTWYYAVAYAAGFATGNYCGVWLEGKLAIGLELVRTISVNPHVDLAGRLREQGYAVVEVPGAGPGRTQVEVLLLVERRRRVPELLALIERTDRDAVTTVSDVKRQHLGAGAALPSGNGWRRWLSVAKKK